MKKTLLSLLLSLTLASCFHTPSPPPSTNSPQTEQTKSEPSQPAPAGYTGDQLAGNSAPLLDFNQADYERALLEYPFVFLYFYANWCPICLEEVPNALYPAFNQLDSDQIIGFRVNFKDSATDRDEQELARQFAVPYQHFKLILKDGQPVFNSNQEWTTQDYLDNIDSIITY